MTAQELDLADVPDFAEALTAWRVWRVVAEDGGYRLGSVVKSAVWPAGEPLVAECLRDGPLVPWFRRRRAKGHDVPDERCECGIYGASLSVVREYLYERPPGYGGLGRVLGEVSLWGTVVECERGLRASRAYPLRLYVPVDAASRSGHSRDRFVDGLEVYGVPVEPLPVGCADAVTLLRRLHVVAS